MRCEKRRFHPVDEEDRSCILLIIRAIRAIRGAIVLFGVICHPIGMESRRDGKPPGWEAAGMESRWDQKVA
jgi:hypothetical protein